jgi:hypothetical protein
VVQVMPFSATEHPGAEGNTLNLMPLPGPSAGA